MTNQVSSNFGKSMKISMYLICSVIIIMTLGCSSNKESPYAARAREKLKEGDKESAVNLFKEAVDDNPKVADVHLDLAILLHDYKQDYIGAIYHYQRYLDLMPQGQYNHVVEERIRKAKQALVTSPEFAGMREEGGGEALKKKLIEVMEENMALKAKLQSLEAKQSGKTTPTSGKTTAGQTTTKKTSSGIKKSSSSSSTHKTASSGVTL